MRERGLSYCPILYMLKEELYIINIGKIFVYGNCFCYLNVQNVKQKISPANSSLVCILITIGDVTIFAIDLSQYID